MSGKPKNACLQTNGGAPIHTKTTQTKELQVELIAHEDQAQRLLLASVTAAEIEETEATEAPPLNLAVVIDRSGSMSGPKLEIARRAVARLIRTLRPQDRIAVVVYDDSVDVVSPLTAPSEGLAHEVEHIAAGGSTNLYGGWLTGAKLVGAGGRVVLLSDGLANVGRFVDAASLSAHAELSYEKYKVTTTTIGIGEDYDEGLMAGMASAGGGTHYFARDADAIMEAFSQERFSIGAVALRQVSIRYHDSTFQLGHLWAGETKHVAMPIQGLAAPAATIRYTVAATQETFTIALEMPEDFGHSDLATLVLLLDRAALVQDGALRVRDQDSAREAAASLRQIVLAIMAHPLSDGEMAVTAVAQLKNAIDRLDDLARQYDEYRARMGRKYMMQTQHNLRNPGKAFSSFQEDDEIVHRMSAAARGPAPMAQALVMDTDLFRLAPPDCWRRWEAIPVSKKGRVLHVVMSNPRDGFVLHDIEERLKLRVSPNRIAVPSAELLALIDQYAVNP